MDLSILVMEKCLLSKQAISLGSHECVCVGYSCVINQWHLECDYMQWGEFVQCFILMCCRQQFVYYNYMVLHPSRP